MDWETWRPKYESIVERLDIDSEMDRCSAEVLHDILEKTDPSELERQISGNECVIFGAGPSLEEDLERMSRVGWLDKVLVSADGATSAVMEYEIPTVIVTDLDGELADQIEAWRRGAWMVVHAHGDNLEEVRRVVPKLEERVLGTIQVDKPGQLPNFGGFTDGDRAAFMLHELGASRIYLAGMDLGAEIGKYSGRTERGSKLIKLEICRDLLSWLADEFEAELVNVTAGGEEIPGVPRGEIS
ncbi:hypothetical protein AKJ63_00365 [candidate division MSBL1 archaeon SCGC-AAA259D18]|uniref:6-hydroxymethyl-7,8-dihydropterin pyrophosphokinase n=1 Tax=candidate division MSBL1 archaeon SCGC-AAA259D18 TaxID=1698262 RepID=A0A133UCK3_9EURY|nr:hypothetical protein AKJ63_00365 [candidate division MSBL1 archaeon SCGC-AAA259D18]